MGAPMDLMRKKKKKSWCETSQSHDFVSASDSSHQQAGKHDAHYLKAQSQQRKRIRTWTWKCLLSTSLSHAGRREKTLMDPAEQCGSHCWVGVSQLRVNATPTMVIWAEQRKHGSSQASFFSSCDFNHKGADHTSHHFLISYTDVSTGRRSTAEATADRWESAWLLSESDNISKYSEKQSLSTV